MAGGGSLSPGAGLPSQCFGAACVCSSCARGVSQHESPGTHYPSHESLRAGGCGAMIRMQESV